MDGYLAAITADIKKDEDANLYVLKIRSALANAFAEIVRSAIVLLHQIVLHRRDMGLLKSEICSSAIGCLRHTPFLGSQHSILRK